MYLQKGTSHSQNSTSSNRNPRGRGRGRGSGRESGRQIVASTRLGRKALIKLRESLHSLKRTLLRLNTLVSPSLVGSKSTPAGPHLIGRCGRIGILDLLETLADGDGGNSGGGDAGVARCHDRGVGCRRLSGDDGEEGHSGDGEDGGETHLKCVCVFLKGRGSERGLL